MPTPPNTANYQVGGAIVILGGIDLGNIVNLTFDPTDMDVLQHLSARSGARKVDKQVVTRKRLTFRAELDEHSASTWRKYFMAGGTGLEVNAMTDPLVETNCYLQWLNESGNIVTFSHTKVTTRPAGAMDFNSFGEWVTFEIEIEILEDLSATPATMGKFTFLA